MNRLQYETSPYLLQHKNNPVDWYPWGDEAFKKAIDEDKIIILSIGYSTCHWCHVMERESFENVEVAKLMNENFVCIKLDREERPDVDSIYMESLQNMGKSGGWPMNMFLIPTGEPFFGGTYFPKNQWLEILSGVSKVYKNQKEEVIKAAKGFKDSLNAKDSDRFYFGEETVENVHFSKGELEVLAGKIKSNFDKRHGGMNRAPKFPMPSLWKMIYHLGLATKDNDLLNHVDFTLKRMVLGGIFDHLGGGWTRYSTDIKWKVPHFEKMLYDNGQLLQLYAEASARTENFELFKWGLEQTLAWIKSDMSAKEGGLYSAQDADSEGEEGKFYVWSKDEIDDLLGENADQYRYAYQISDAGNWEDGKNILHLETIPDKWDEIKEFNKKLLKFREKRVYPGLDNKIIVSWNALAISGIIAMKKLLGGDYGFVKQKLDFLNENLRFSDEEGLKGVYHQAGEKKIHGFLDDYAALIQANIDMYAFIYDEKYLKTADELTKYVLNHFFDEEEGLFFYTDDDGEQLIARKKEIFDNVIPSSNSMMAKVLYFAGRYLGNNEYLERAKRMFSIIMPMLGTDPQWLSNWLDLGLLLSEKQKEVVITGESAIEWTKVLRSEYKYRATLFFATDSESSLEVFESRFLDKDAIFICENYACQLPVYNLDDAKSILNED